MSITLDECVALLYNNNPKYKRRYLARAYKGGSLGMRKSAGELLIELNIASRSACDLSGAHAEPLTLRVKLLYLLSGGPLSPAELMDRLCMVKSNLALLTGKMQRDGELTKTRRPEDRRAVVYAITEKGMEVLKRTVIALEDKFKGILTNEKEYDEGVSKFGAVLHLLSFL